MTPEIRQQLESLHNRLASQGQTGEFVKQAHALLIHHRDKFTPEEFQSALRTEVARVCDDDAHIDHCISGLSAL